MCFVFIMQIFGNKYQYIKMIYPKLALINLFIFSFSFTKKESFKKLSANILDFNTETNYSLKLKL